MNSTEGVFTIAELEAMVNEGQVQPTDARPKPRFEPQNYVPLDPATRQEWQDRVNQLLTEQKQAQQAASGAQPDTEMSANLRSEMIKASADIFMRYIQTENVEEGTQFLLRIGPAETAALISFVKERLASGVTESLDPVYHKKATRQLTNRETQQLRFYLEEIILAARKAFLLFGEMGDQKTQPISDPEFRQRQKDKLRGHGVGGVNPSNPIQKREQHDD